MLAYPVNKSHCKWCQVKDQSLERECLEKMKVQKILDRGTPLNSKTNWTKLMRVLENRCFNLHLQTITRKSKCFSINNNNLLLNLLLLRLLKIKVNLKGKSVKHFWLILMMRRLPLISRLFTNCQIAKLKRNRKWYKTIRTFEVPLKHLFSSNSKKDLRVGLHKIWIRFKYLLLRKSPRIQLNKFLLYKSSQI